MLSWPNWSITGPQYHMHFFSLFFLFEFHMLLFWLAHPKPKDTVYICHAYMTADNLLCILLVIPYMSKSWNENGHMSTWLVFLSGISVGNVWQIENEYGNIQGNYGQAGKRYMQWAAQMAIGLDTGIPWVMCRQTDAPEEIVGDLIIFWFLLILYCFGNCMK